MLCKHRFSRVYDQVALDRLDTVVLGYIVYSPSQPWAYSTLSYRECSALMMSRSDRFGTALQDTPWAFDIDQRPKLYPLDTAYTGQLIAHRKPPSSALSGRLHMGYTRSQKHWPYMCPPDRVCIRPV